MSRLRVLALALSPLALFLSCAPAQAKFTVCNKTEHALAVAIGRYQGGVWVSEGWWKVEPQGCSDVLRGALKARYYYLRGVHEGVDGAWNGNRFFCVATDNFTIKGRGDCKKRGFGQVGFFEIDTGEYTDWVQNLSD